MSTVATETRERELPPVEPLPSPPVSRPTPSTWQAFVDRNDRYIRLAVDIFVLAVCVLFVFLQLGPSNILSDTTPSGGDMGAHVWGPAYLRDHLLPNFQVTGWTPDWYAGFPAYQFYMVLPSLLIVVLNFGVGGVGASVLAGLAVGALGLAVGLWPERGRRNLALAVGIVCLACVGVPYGVAFKLVSVAGALSLPLAAYGFGRLAGLRFPGPALLGVATLPYLFYRAGDTYNIIGGNLGSTLAGEFAFSISLSLALLYLGVVIRGLETGRYRALAAVLLALTGLCHIIPAFWALAGTVVIVAMRLRRANSPLLPSVVLVSVGLPLLLVGLQAGSRVMLLGALALLGVAAWLFSQSVRWVAPVLLVGGMLAAFWVAPFALRGDFVNDMGWEKLPYGREELHRTFAWWEVHKLDQWWDYWDGWAGLNMPHLVPHFPAEADLRWVFGLAAVGVVLSIVNRSRAGVFLGIMTVLAGLAFVHLPEGRLWNGRLLPFYLLTTTMLGFVAVSELVRLVTRWTRQRMVLAGSLGALGGLAAMLVVVGLPLGVLWYGECLTTEGSMDCGVAEERIEDQTAAGETPLQITGHRWPSFSPWRMSVGSSSFIPGWANWNYSGFEEKPNYREYYDVVQTMQAIGEDEEYGCGRAMWEYNKDTLDRYGTPMALMLLPYWTDGCIGSMEGLFFEASTTTPFHFLMQTELSEAPSSAQRDMPYAGFNFELGVQHMQLLGVRYYMATTETAIQAARAHPYLTEIATSLPSTAPPTTSPPWVIFEVGDSEPVVSLEAEPAVLDGVGHSADDWMRSPRRWQYGEEWLVEEEYEELTGRDKAQEDLGRHYGPSVEWFLDPQSWTVPLSVGGPDDWQRVEPDETPETRSVTPAEVSNIDMGRDRISFDVENVGSPVLVKASYFPNWRVSGAEGPWRVAPNLMVVVPTDEHVELTYGSTPVEWFAYVTTGVGLVAVVFLASRGRYRFRSRRAAEGTG